MFINQKDNNDHNDHNVKDTIWLCCNKRTPCVKYCESPFDKHKCGVLVKSKYLKNNNKKEIIC